MIEKSMLSMDNLAPAVPMEEPDTDRYSSSDAEASLIGCVLINPDIYSTIEISLSDFSIIRHRWIWHAIGQLIEGNTRVDPVTLADQLEKDKKLYEIGGPAYLARLITFPASFINAPDYVAVIKRYARSSKILELAGRLAKKSNGNGAELGDIITELVKLQEKIHPNGAANFTTWLDLDGVIGPISWAWQDWLAKGFLNILVGMTGEGKSILSLRVCGSYLLGWSWPDGKPFAGETGNVIWCEAEAAQALNLERAKKWGLPIDKLLNPLGDPLADFRLNNQEHKDKLAFMAMRPDVSFIVVDSLSGADPTAEKSTEDACNVSWLAALARDIQKPIQLTHHLRKRNIFDKEGEVTLDRVRGISTILQFSRLIWALDTPDLAHKENKRLSVIKSNLGKKPAPIGVTIGDHGVTFGDAPQAPHVETIADKAGDMLLALLRKQPMQAAYLEDELEQAGISWRSAQRVKSKLGIVSIKKEDGKWYWSLPPKPEDVTNDYTDI
jgi:hypothetical protein